MTPPRATRCLLAPRLLALRLLACPRRMAAHWAALYIGGGGAMVARRGLAQQPRIEGGRVRKPARQRYRASRQAPVTLLNTDTSNFRSMAQQFTGIPSASYSPAASPIIRLSAPRRPRPPSISFNQLNNRQTAAVVSSLQSQLFRPQRQYAGYGGMPPATCSCMGLSPRRRTRYCKSYFNVTSYQF